MKHNIVAALVLLGLGGVGCALDSTGRAPGPQIWMDAPVDGIGVAVGTPVAVMAHSNDPIDRSILLINDVPFVELTTTQVGDTLWEATGAWTPVATGRFHLRVRGYSGSDEINSNAISVDVMETHSSHMELATPTATQVDTLASVVMPTITNTPWPPAQIQFWADALALSAGCCTNLHWDVAYATAVLLDNEPVTPQSQMQICPPQTSTYLLHIESPSGNADRSLTITIIPSTATPIATPIPDTTGPAISSVSYAPSKIWDMPACGSTTAAITAKASDPSGISRVELHYLVSKGAKKAVWSVLAMSSGGGGAYTATLGPADGGSTVSFYVTAQDGKGNITQSKSFSFPISSCLL